MRARICAGLEWLGLSWDEDVTYQGANLARHQADGRKLLESGAAYRCFCTQAELDRTQAMANARLADARLARALGR